MKTVTIETEMPDDFKVGECKKCPFHRGSDNCDIMTALTGGACKLDCFCPLKEKQ